MKQATNIKCYRANNGRYFRASVINVMVAIAIALLIIAFLLFFSEVVVDDTKKFVLYMLLKTVLSGAMGFAGYCIIKWVDKTFW